MLTPHPAAPLPLLQVRIASVDCTEQKDVCTKAEVCLPLAAAFSPCATAVVSVPVTWVAAASSPTQHAKRGGRA